MNGTDGGARSPSSQLRRAEKRPHPGGASADPKSNRDPSGDPNGHGPDQPSVGREFQQNIPFTRDVSINLRRDTSLGPLYQNLDPLVAAPSVSGVSPSSNGASRDPAIDAALTLTDCFLRRESSLEKLGLLKRESSLGVPGGKGATRVEWRPPAGSTMPPPHGDPAAMRDVLPPPPPTERQSSLHSLASIAELTSTEKGARSIFGDDVADAPAEPLERNLSLVFQQQDSARDLLAQGVAPDSSDDEDDDSGDEGHPKAKPAPYKPQNSYEFFAQNTPQQVFGTGRQPDEESPHDLFAPSFNDLAAVCLNQDPRRHAAQRAPPGNTTAWMPPGTAASPMRLHQNSAPQPEAVKYIGKLTVEERKKRVQRYLDKKKRRIWGRKVEYQCRKNLASKRARVHGRFA